jgi:putative cell wall-binding protein
VAFHDYANTSLIPEFYDNAYDVASATPVTVGTTSSVSVIDDELSDVVSPVSRLSGADRYATSAAISAATFPVGVAVAYIANGGNLPDALSAAPVAALQSAPVLLVPSDSIPAAIQAELTRLHPARIVVLGGVNAVSKAVAQQLLTFIGK